MEWYDKIAGLYDLSTAWLYRRARRALIDKLEIQAGDRVLILACGTGQSLALIEERIGDRGEIVALDHSEAMLAVASKTIGRNGWDNIRLLQMDARDLSAGYLDSKGIAPGFDIVIGELAFSVIPDWEKVMRTACSLLRKGARFGLLDWHRGRHDWLTKAVNLLADARIERDTAGAAKRLCGDFAVVGKFLSGNIYIGIGRRI